MIVTLGADTWDEWLPVDTPRVAPKNTHSRTKSSVIETFFPRALVMMGLCMLMDQ
jgi:hypothetical protein